MCWYTPATPTLGRLRQEDYDFEASLGYTASGSPKEFSRWTLELGERRKGREDHHSGPCAWAMSGVRVTAKGIVGLQLFTLREERGEKRQRGAHVLSRDASRPRVGRHGCDR